MDLQLQIATEDHPDQRSIRVHVAQAREAVEVYNQLAEATPGWQALPFHLLSPALGRPAPGPVLPLDPAVRPRTP